MKKIVILLSILLISCSQSQESIKFKDIGFDTGFDYFEIDILKESLFETTSIYYYKFYSFSLDSNYTYLFDSVICSVLFFKIPNVFNYNQKYIIRYKTNKDRYWNLFHFECVEKDSGKYYLLGTKSIPPEIIYIISENNYKHG